MNQILTELVEKLLKAHQNELVSVILYGSAVSDETRDQYSDYNVLCVLHQVTPAQLAASEPIFHWWREMKNPAPLLLSAQEVVRSSDCFAIEFHDMKERREVLHGPDLIADLNVDNSFYRAQVEHELRSKLLRLRQKAGGLLSHDDLLVRLMLDSISTFCVLFRHALLLDGMAPKYNKRQVVLDAQERFGIDASPFLTLLDVREKKLKFKNVEAAGVFASYLKQIEIVVDRVDAMEK